MTFAMGIDIGTSKVAIVVISSATGELFASASMPTNANLDASSLFAEQDVSKIMNCVDEAIASLPLDTKQRVSSIGVTGQMHGVLFWNSKDGSVSPLITWHDRRCNQGNFLADLSLKTGDNSIKSGYGCATMAWVVQNQPQLLQRMSCATTIHDYLVCQIAGLKRPVTDPTNAASWGFFDITEKQWEAEKVEQANIPLCILPEVKPTGSLAGKLSPSYAKKWGLSHGTPVTVALGDNQASLYATLGRPSDDIGITLGTGGQLAVIISNPKPYLSNPLPTNEIRPYLDNYYAVVAASLSGGSAWSWLPQVVETWCQELGINPPRRDDLFEKLSELGSSIACSPLKVSSSFIGERHDTNRRGSIQGIDMGNFSLANLSRALGESILRNLKDMLPEFAFANRKRVVGSGNAIRKSPLIQQLIQEVFHLPLELSVAEEEAAQGAAKLSLRNR